MQRYNVVNTFAPFKIVLLGNTGCGKTSLLHYWLRSTRGEDDPSILHDAPTIGVEFGLAYVSDYGDDKNKKDEQVWKFNIWDTGGQERFRCITRNYYRGCHIVILVYDITDYSSYAAIPMWMNDIKSFYTEKDMPLMVLIGNKTDRNVERQVSTYEALDYARQYDMMFFETSTISGTSVVHAWRSITKQMIGDAISSPRLKGYIDYISSGFLLSLDEEDENNDEYVPRRKKCCII